MNKRIGVAGGTQEQPALPWFLMARYTILGLCSGQEGKETAYKEHPPKRGLAKKEEVRRLLLQLSLWIGL